MCKEERKVERFYAYSIFFEDNAPFSKIALFVPESAKGKRILRPREEFMS